MDAMLCTRDGAAFNDYLEVRCQAERSTQAIKGLLQGKTPDAWASNNNCFFGDACWSEVQELSNVANLGCSGMVMARSSSR